jgi:hypothetical protein
MAEKDSTPKAAPTQNDPWQALEKEARERDKSRSEEGLFDGLF